MIAVGWFCEVCCLVDSPSKNFNDDLADFAPNDRFFFHGDGEFDWIFEYVSLFVCSWVLRLLDSL